MKKICIVLMMALICTAPSLRADNNYTDTITQQKVNKSIGRETIFLDKLTESAKNYDFYYVLSYMNDSVSFSVKINGKQYGNVVNKEKAVTAINSMFKEVYFDSFDIMKYDEKTESGEDAYSVEYMFGNEQSILRVSIIFYLMDGKITKIFLY